MSSWPHLGAAARPVCSDIKRRLIDMTGTKVAPEGEVKVDELDKKRGKRLLVVGIIFACSGGLIVSAATHRTTARS